MKITKFVQSHKKLFVLLAVVIVAIAAVGTLEALDVTHLVHSKKQQDVAVGKVASPVTKGVKGGTSDKAGNKQDVSDGSPATAPSSSTTQPGADKQAASSGPVLAPTGTFANVYKNVGTNDNMQSTCNTSAGAYCEIIFTSGGTTKQLPKKLVDDSGAAFWSWTPSSIGLSKGNWHITARASSGTDSKVTDNGSLELEITQ